HPGDPTRDPRGPRLRTLAARAHDGRGCPRARGAHAAHSRALHAARAGGAADRAGDVHLRVGHPVRGVPVVPRRRHAAPHPVVGQHHGRGQDVRAARILDHPLPRPVPRAHRARRQPRRRRAARDAGRALANSEGGFALSPPKNSAARCGVRRRRTASYALRMVARASLPAGFNRLAWSNLAAQSAEQIALAAVPIVAVITLGAGAGDTGLLQTAQTLPFLILSIPAGVLADRTSRRRVMAAAEALRALALAAVLALAQLGGLTLPLLALLGFVGACGTVAYSVAAPALVPALVPADTLPVANGRIELARTVAFASGPALGGALVGWTGGAPAFGIAAALSGCAVVLLAGLREPARPPRPALRVLHELREGAAFVFGHPLLRPVFVTQLVFNTAFFMIQAVYVPYAVHQLGLSAFGVGVTLATYGVGMVVGALLAPRLIETLPF